MQAYYTTGEFAQKAKVTIRTIRYYDRIGILKPSLVTEGRYRLYTDQDFGKLLKILSLKSLGFSLQEISVINLKDDSNDLKTTLSTQYFLLKRRLEQMQVMELALHQTMELFKHSEELDWNEILKLIHMCSTEKSLVEQYKDETNLDIRISFHEKCSTNKQGWFSWIFNQFNLKSNTDILELGCGNARLWSNLKMNKYKNMKIYLTDRSEGMIKDASNYIEGIHNKYSTNFIFEKVDCMNIPYSKNSFDMVIANHMLFYVENISHALSKIQNVMKKNAIFYCSTYGKNHMIEITMLVKEFDPKIVLSDTPLYERFGIENGMRILSEEFSHVELRMYEDELLVKEAEPLMMYILSCHGNQNDILYRRQDDFKDFLQKKIEEQGTIHITKEAGLFICKK
ncbi:MAG: MerR family transcriptional regulator [bacterium]|nr:MerR family transcriptional regulator [bacterium]